MSENPPSATYFPLRWEGTGDKWWYASPIDCAAANGHYELVRELIRLDANHLISLTSLRRLRRLESVWDDAGNSHFSGAAKSRSAVARQLLLDSEISVAGNKRNPLIGAGYGGWLLYTAAFAGDLDFVRELLRGDPLLVFGEGEYGLTEMLYAAARSGSAKVFWALYDFAASPRFEGAGSDLEVPSGFKWEVVNRAVHAAARGGNSAVLAELLGGDGDGVLGYRDANGSTVLHAAAGRGQVKVVKYLITMYDDIISSTDNKGNTALHVAAYKGQLPVVETLLTASPSSITSTNNAGNTLLHMAVAGAISPGFRRLDRLIELTKPLIGNKYNVEDVINARNNEGRTALHNAIIGNVHSDLVQLLMTARYINVNVRDDHGMTSLDYLRHKPRSSSSEMLMRQLISAGGMSNCQDYSARKAMASHLRMQGAMCSSPGTSFRVLDSEIFKYSGMEHLLSGSRTNHTEITLSQCGSNGEDEEEQVASGNKKRVGPVEIAAKKLRTILFQWPKAVKKLGSSILNEAPIPLRERFLGDTTGNKRTRSNVSSPTTRKKFASGDVQGIMVDLPHGNAAHGGAMSSSLSKTSNSSHSSVGKDMVPDEADEMPRLMHTKKGLMKQYLCFGGSRLSVKNSIGRRNHRRHGNKQPIQTTRREKVQFESLQARSIKKDHAGKAPSSDDPQHYDIAIVGGGLVGMALASSLASNPLTQKLNFAIIDGSPTLRNGICIKDNEPPDPRMSELGELLNNTGMHTSEIDCQKTLLNSKLTSLTLPSVASKSSTGNTQLAKLELDNGSTLVAKLVVGADGGKSRRFLPNGPIALLPMGDNYSNIVWSMSPDESSDRKTMNSDDFVKAVNDALDYGYGPRPQSNAHVNDLFSWLTPPAISPNEPFEVPPKVTKLVSERMVFPLSLMHSKSYTSNRVVLIGDAAHTVHPLAGQGVNLGFGDASALARVISEGVALGADFGEVSTLRKYEAERRPVNTMMASVLDGFQKAYSVDFGPLNVLRAAALQGAHHLSPLKRSIIQYASVPAEAKLTPVAKSEIPKPGSKYAGTNSLSPKASEAKSEASFPLQNLPMRMNTSSR
ncbi:hypothetical protein V2J09_002697 [Rumex salicifolius]